MRLVVALILQERILQKKNQSEFISAVALYQQGEAMQPPQPSQLPFIELRNITSISNAPPPKIPALSQFSTENFLSQDLTPQNQFVDKPEPAHVQPLPTVAEVPTLRESQPEPMEENSPQPFLLAGLLASDTREAGATFPNQNTSTHQEQPCEESHTLIVTQPDPQQLSADKTETQPPCQPDQAQSVVSQATSVVAQSLTPQSPSPQVQQALSPQAFSPQPLSPQAQPSPLTEPLTPIVHNEAAGPCYCGVTIMYVYFTFSFKLQGRTSLRCFVMDVNDGVTKIV